MVEILEVRKNPLSVLFLAVSAAVFLVAQVADPETIISRFPGSGNCP